MNNAVKFALYSGFAIISFIATRVYAASPSYNCSNANDGVETIICENLFLSDLDNQLAKAYRNVIANVPSDSIDEIRREQVSWITKRNSCIDDYQGKSSVTECIKYFYRSRYNQLTKIVSLEETYSHQLYREGNDAYKAGNYYDALAKYHQAYDSASDYVEKIRTLGALAQISREQENIALAKGYAEKILSIDPTSQFAQDIQSLESNSSYSTNYSSNFQSQPTYTAPERRQSSSDERAIKCLALTWGPDVCGHAFSEYAKKNLGTDVSDVISSPLCGAAISKALNTEFTESDLQLAVLTGALDSAGKAGVDSDNFFANMFGGFAYIYSFAVKASIFDRCMSQ